MNQEQRPSPEISRLQPANGLDRVPWRALAWAWSIFIVLICLAPHNPGPSSDLPLDKLAHFLLFAAFGALWLQSYPRQFVKISIAGTLLGLGIEIAQSALGWGRMGDGADFFADCLGLFTVLAGRLPLRCWGQARKG